jgi:anti-sigma factor RsiW
MGKAEDERLQRYFDGELPPEERARVEAALDDDDRLALAAMGEVQGLVRNTLLAEAEGIDLWPALAGRLGGGASKAETRAYRRWGLHLHPARWSAGFATLAAAAALLFVLQPWHAAHAQNGCDIESLDTFGAVATVFRMDDAPHRGDEATTIIWTTEDD